MKYLFTLVLGIGFVTSTFAQFEVGGYFTGQKTSITTGAESTNLPTYTAGGGLLTAYNFTNNIALLSGLIYNRHSQKFKTVYDPSDANGFYEGRKRLDYLKLPIALRFSYPVGGKVNIFGFAGPQLNFLLKSSGAVEVIQKDETGKIVYYDLPPSENKYFKTFNVEATVGVGGEFMLVDNLYLSSIFKTDLGLGDAEKKGTSYNGTDGSDKPKASNRTFSLMIGIVYRIPNAHHILAPHGPSRGTKRR